MGVGAEVYGDGDFEAGNPPRYSTAYRGGFILDTITITTANNTGSTTNASLANGTPFFLLMGSLGVSGLEPTVSFSGTTISWTAGLGGWEGKLMYGIR